jgi:hypothetical protein
LPLKAIAYGEKKVLSLLYVFRRRHAVPSPVVLDPVDGSACLQTQPWLAGPNLRPAGPNLPFSDPEAKALMVEAVVTRPKTKGNANRDIAVDANGAQQNVSSDEPGASISVRAMIRTEAANEGRFRRRFQKLAQVFPQKVVPLSRILHPPDRSTAAGAPEPMEWPNIHRS